MNIHTVFDLIAWASGALIGYGVRHRYLAQGSQSFRLSQHPGYVIAVAPCAGAGALLVGGGNMALAGMLPLGHSVAGAITGGIIGAEGYKLARGIKGSTGLEGDRVWFQKRCLEHGVRKTLDRRRLSPD